jgi:hypothetical protein
MRLLRTTVLATVGLASFSFAHAQRSDYDGYQIKICNVGSLDFSVAYAEKKPEGLGRYSWHVNGWTPIRVRQCEIVYDVNLWTGGVGISKPIVHLAFTFTNSAGAWGANVLNVSGTGIQRPSSLKFCGRKADFRYQSSESEFAGSSNNCADGYFAIPASIDYEPEHPDGKGPYGAPKPYEIDVDLDNTAHLYPLRSNATTTATLKPSAPGTLNAIFLGKKVVASTAGDPDHRRWYAEDGSWALEGNYPTSFFDFRIAHIPLESDDLSQVAKLWGSIAEDLEKSKTDRWVLGDDNANGRICFSLSSRVECVNYAALDLQKGQVGLATDGPLLSVPCRNNERCVLNAANHLDASASLPAMSFSGKPTWIKGDDYFFLEPSTVEGGRIILSGLIKLATIFSKYAEPIPIQTVR